MQPKQFSWHTISYFLKSLTCQFQLWPIPTFFTVAQMRLEMVVDSFM